jgi:hypothetical protein
MSASSRPRNEMPWSGADSWVPRVLGRGLGTTRSPSPRGGLCGPKARALGSARNSRVVEGDDAPGQVRTPGSGWGEGGLLTPG